VNKSIKITLPPIIEISSYGGDWNKYINAVYNIFRNQLILKKNYFRKILIRLLREPYINNREFTFYHITNEGKSESERTPDLRRCERIGWIRPIIKNCDNWKLKVWENKRRNRKRICILLEPPDDLDFIIILEYRKKYFLLWTMYTVEQSSRKRKLLKEYHTFHKQRPPT